MRTYLLFTTNRAAINLSGNLMTLRFFFFFSLPAWGFWKTAVGSGGHLTDCPWDDVQMVCASAGNRLSLVGRASRNKCKIARKSNGDRVASSLLLASPPVPSILFQGSEITECKDFVTVLLSWSKLHTFVHNYFPYVLLLTMEKSRWLLLCLIDTNSVESNDWFWLKWSFLNCVVVRSKIF